MNDFDWDLFDRYLAGSATPAERQKFEQWLAGDPEREPLVRAFQAALQNLEGDVTEEEVEALWQGVAQRTGASRKKRSGWIVGAGVAAAALAVVASTIVVMQQGKSQQIVGVPRGQVRHLVLPDSTEVILGGGSTLRHPERFGRDSREVTLEGEGAFRVHHPGGLPFRVHAGDLVATDLGTEFMVQAFPEVGGAQIVVRSGVVAVQAREESAARRATYGPVSAAGSAGMGRWRSSKWIPRHTLRGLPVPWSSTIRHCVRPCLAWRVGTTSTFASPTRP